MTDSLEDNKDNIKLHPLQNTIQPMNRQASTVNSHDQSVSPHYTSVQSHSQSVLPSSQTAHHSAPPMLGNHEMVAPCNQNNTNLPSQNSMQPQGNSNLSHQPHLQHPHHHTSHQMQQGNAQHLISSSNHQVHPALSTHHNSMANNISTQMQQSQTSGNLILGGDNLMSPKEENPNPLSSSMLDEFEQQMNQYQQQH